MSNKFKGWGLTIVEGEMGGGKTTTAVGEIVDEYFRQLYAVQSPKGNWYACRQYVDEVGRRSKEFVELVDKDDNPTGRVVRIPDDFVVWSTLKIFTVNIHLYGGIRYVFFSSVAELMQQSNKMLAEGGVILIDESYIEADARRSQNPVDLVLTWFGMQIRKRRLEMYLIVQNRRFLEWRLRFILVRHIFVRYNEALQMVTVKIKYIKEGGREKNFHYYSPQYWKYFDTNEIPHMPEYMLEKVLKRA